MNIVKSILVMLGFIVLLFFSLRKIYVSVRDILEKNVKYLKLAATICLVWLTSALLVEYGHYMYPFDRTIEPDIHAQFQVPEEYALDYPGQKQWHGAYERYWIYPESRYFDTDNKISCYGIPWPTMDFDDHSYIITYGQKIESLTFNAWDTIDNPYSTGAMRGRIAFEEGFCPDMVYVYEIPKMRIENDRIPDWSDGAR